MIRLLAITNDDIQFYAHIGEAVGAVIVVIAVIQALVFKKKTPPKK